MSRPSETGSVRNGAREELNLGRQYRPIGIGAVAAAIAVAEGRTATDITDEKENRGSGGGIPRASKAA